MIAVTTHAYEHWIGRCEKLIEAANYYEHVEWMVRVAESGRLPTKSERRALMRIWDSRSADAEVGCNCDYDWSEPISVTADSFIVSDSADVAFFLALKSNVVLIVSAARLSEVMAEYVELRRKRKKWLKSQRRHRKRIRQQPACLVSVTA